MYIYLNVYHTVMCIVIIIKIYVTYFVSQLHSIFPIFTSIDCVCASQRTAQRVLHVEARQRELEESNALLTRKKEQMLAALSQEKLARQTAASKAAIKPLREVAAPTLAHGLTLGAIEEKIEFKMVQHELTRLRKDQSAQAKDIQVSWGP